MKLRKIRRSVRIVRTVRTENGFTDRTNRTVREKDLRIVNIVFNRWKRQLVTKWSLHEKIRRSVRIVRTVRTENGDHGSWNFVSRFSHLARSNQHGVLHKQFVILVEDNFCIAMLTVNDGFLVMKSVCDIVRRFVVVFYTCYEQSWHGIKCHRQ